MTNEELAVNAIAESAYYGKLYSLDWLEGIIGRSLNVFNVDDSMFMLAVKHELFYEKKIYLVICGRRHLVIPTRERQLQIFMRKLKGLQKRYNQ